MMRAIERSNAFKRDYKREAKGRHKAVLSDLVKEAVLFLVHDEPLESRYRDHDLVGNWVGCRECHLKPDLLLIYRKFNHDLLQLVRLGSHSELFR